MFSDLIVFVIVCFDEIKGASVSFGEAVFVSRLASKRNRQTKRRIEHRPHICKCDLNWDLGSTDRTRGDREAERWAAEGGWASDGIAMLVVVVAAAAAAAARGE
jgi:hypothetical protein